MLWSLSWALEIFSSIPGLHPLEVSNTHTHTHTPLDHDDQKYLQTLSTVLLGKKITLNWKPLVWKTPQVLIKSFLNNKADHYFERKSKLVAGLFFCHWTAYHRYHLNRIAVLLFSKNTDASVYRMQENSIINLLAYLS